MRWKKFLTLLVMVSVTLTKLLSHPDSHSGVSSCERGLIPAGRVRGRDRSSAGTQ